MGYWDDIRGGVTGLFNGIVNTIGNLLNGSSNTNENNTNYTNEDDTAEDDTSTQKFITYIVYGKPLRETKFLFVPEMEDFCSDDELNTAYHSKSEYTEAVNKYGFIYKSQKFENADTAEKLLDYAIDWIKNNYHGGITSFSITALDMHLAGVTEMDIFVTGSRVEVQYPDPLTQKNASQILTVISSEYDLCNPENNQYKIGIPDVTLNKVYGETAKSGGGGGGGKPSDEEDDDTNTEVNTLEGMEEELENIINQNFWAHMIDNISSDDGSIPVLELLTPKEKNPTSTWSFAMAADALKTTVLQSASGNIKKLFTQYVDVDGGVNAKQVTTDEVDATDVAVDNNASVKEKTKTKDLEVTNNATINEKTKTKNLEVTGTADIKALKVDGKPISGGGISSTVKVTINGVNYTLQGKTGWD